MSEDASGFYSHNVVSQWSGKMVGLSHALLDPELPDGDLLDQWMSKSRPTDTLAHTCRADSHALSSNHKVSSTHEPCCLRLGVDSAQMSISS
jgi:hypothetical protein